jgi:biotin carboxylase
MKKILILGTASPQVDAIKYCQELGLEVHACGHKMIGEGVEIADVFVLMDIKNKESVLEYCQKNEIDYIYSVGSEIAIPVANYVAKKLGLPYFLEPENTDIVNDKIVCRTKLGDDFFANIKYESIESQIELLNWNEFPAVMKPSDSQGQRGVRLVNNLEEAKNCFEEVIRYSPQKKIIVEEYISGPELSVNAFVTDGDVVFFQESDRISFDQYPGGIIKEHLVPSKYTLRNKILKDKIIKMVQESVTRLKIENGPVYYQFKLNDNMDPKLIEVTPRLDGCHMWRLIKYYNGVDLLDATFQLLFENKEQARNVFTKSEKPFNRRYRLKFMMEEPNKKVIKEKYSTENAIFKKWYYEDGDKVREVNGFIERIGYYISPLKL